MTERTQAAQIAGKRSGITRRPDTKAGAYCLAGTRMPVTAIKRCMAVWTVAEMQAEYPWITVEQIQCALNFRGAMQ